MKHRSLQFNGIEWECTQLSEQVLVLAPVTEQEKLPLIHAFLDVLEGISLEGVTDVIPAYDSLALVYDDLLYDTHDAVHSLEKLQAENKQAGREPKEHRIAVCYELGMDWVEVLTHTGLTKHEIIQAHTEKQYTLAMMGFLPGFLYLDGLDPALSCPRKATPRSRIPEGSVGIGGDQTGVYSLESPGGWQIIGKTPQSFFDPKQDPPCALNIGDKINFYPIDESEFKIQKAKASS